MTRTKEEWHEYFSRGIGNPALRDNAVADVLSAIAEAREEAIKECSEIVQAHQQSYHNPSDIAVCRNIDEDIRRLSAGEGRG